MKNILVLILFMATNGFALSIDQKVDLNKKIVTFSSFEEAKNKGVINGKFYGNESEKYFEKIKLTGDFSNLSDRCSVKGSVMGYRDIEAPLFINSLPVVSANEFQSILYSLNYMYATSINLVIEFSKECKKDENFPDVIVIQQREEIGDK